MAGHRRVSNQQRVRATCQNSKNDQQRFSAVY